MEPCALDINPKLNYLGIVKGFWPTGAWEVVGYVMICVCLLPQSLKSFPQKNRSPCVLCCTRGSLSKKKTDDFYQKMEAETDVNQALGIKTFQ